MNKEELTGYPSIDKPWNWVYNFNGDLPAANKTVYEDLYEL